MAKRSWKRRWSSCANAAAAERRLSADRPVPLGPDQVGRRVVVRRVVPGVRGPSGGPAFNDVLGVLVSLGDRELVIRRADGSEVGIALAEVHLAKPVPPPPAPRGRRAQSGS